MHGVHGVAWSRMDLHGVALGCTEPVGRYLLRSSGLSQGPTSPHLRHHTPHLSLTSSTRRQLIESGSTSRRAKRPFSSGDRSAGSLLVMPSLTSRRNMTGAKWRWPWSGLRGQGLNIMGVKQFRYCMENQWRESLMMNPVPLPGCPSRATPVSPPTHTFLSAGHSRLNRASSLCACSWNMRASIAAASKLLAAVIAWMSPVRCRLSSSCAEKGGGAWISPAKGRVSFSCRRGVCRLEEMRGLLLQGGRGGAGFRVKGQHFDSCCGFLPLHRKA